MLATKHLLTDSNFPSLQRNTLDTLQVNLGYTCNQSCKHCHVNAGPNRTEQMSLDNIENVLRLIKKYKIQKLDLTGGAPELNPHFRYLVSSARGMGTHIIDRCNLTILNEPEQRDLAEFLASNKVEIVASLPCYSEQNVDNQRGKGTFNSSIEGLKKLNKLGYGNTQSGLQLNIMYNPGGSFLPPAQAELEKEYKQKLYTDFNIVFNNLFTLTNMPIMRFGSTLVSKNEFENYMQLLRVSHSESNLDSVMCKNLISIDWRGTIYDCDFNQMLDIPARINDRKTTHIADLNIHDLTNNKILVADHCYGCTAGCGSSCGGAINETL